MYINHACEHTAFVFMVVQALLTKKYTEYSYLYSLVSQIVLKNWVSQCITCSFLHKDSFSYCLVVVTLLTQDIYQFEFLMAFSPVFDSLF